jgi:hypothetical protein
MTLSRGSGPRATAGRRERVAFFGAFLGAVFAAGIPQSLRVPPRVLGRGPRPQAGAA